MLVLRNIEKKTDRIEADYYPENQEAKGHLCIGLPDESVIRHIPVPGYEYSAAASHAKKELIRLAKLNHLPKEKIVMWY